MIQNLIASIEKRFVIRPLSIVFWVAAAIVGAVFCGIIWIINTAFWEILLLWR